MAILVRFYSSLVLLDGWKRIGFAWLAGAVASLGQVPLGLFPVLWICLPVLIALLDSAALGQSGRIAAKRMFATGWAFGFGFFLLTFFWLGAAFLVEAEKFAWAMPLAILVLPAGLALFWGAACAILARLWSDHWTRILWLALALSAAEWLRGILFTGLPWGGFGSALASNGVTMQALALGGLDLMTLFALLLFLLPIIWISRWEVARAARHFSYAILTLFIAQLLYGSWIIYGAAPEVNSVAQAQTDQAAQKAPVIRIIQPNIAQKEKWKLENRSWIFNRLLAMTSQTGPQAPKEDVDLVIWPESAIPFYLFEQPAALAAISRSLPAQSQLITGALRREVDQNGTERVYNSVYWLGKDGTIEGSYDKNHLVPFGEYLPFQSFLEALGLEQLTRLKGGFEEGQVRTIFETERFGSILPLICYEIAFSREVARFSHRPDWIVTVTNDAWFGETIGPVQHLHIARMRAVEFGLPVIRVANTGISAIIDSYGRIEAQIPLLSDGIIQHSLPVKRADTLYAMLGNSIFTTIWTFLIFITIFLRRKV